MLEYFNRWGGTNLNSDLVKLGILPKQVSEYTDADIGSTILIPYNDESEKIALSENGFIEFEVVAVNHHKDINDETKPTITLMSKNILRYTAFDPKEPTNTDSYRAEYGNNRWSVSNIRQWLNSNGVSNKWFTPQHEYDEAPTDDNVGNGTAAYADDPGFLAGFSDEIKQHFATIRNKTILCNADKSALSKDFEETEDKIFLPSYTEMGYGNLDNNNPEGSHITNFNSEGSRFRSGADGYYWMRSPDHSDSSCVYYITALGRTNSSYARNTDTRCRSTFSSPLKIKKL